MALSSSNRSSKERQSKRKREKTNGGDEWRTPKQAFRHLNETFQFIADIAASDRNALCELYCTKECSAFDVNLAEYFSEEIRSSPFPLYIFMNMPYSRKQVKMWLKKAIVEMRRGLGVVALVPYTGQRFWHELVVQEASKIWMIAGRVPYGDPETGVPQNRTNFVSAIVVYCPWGRCTPQTEWITTDKLMQVF